MHKSAQTSTFAHLAGRIAREKAKAIKGAGPEASPVSAPKRDSIEVAERIIAAGAKARGELAPDSPVTPTGTAGQILNAAAVRDSGGPTSSEATGLAAQILAAGEKRRGLSGKKRNA